MPVAVFCLFQKVLDLPKPEITSVSTKIDGIIGGLREIGQGWSKMLGGRKFLGENRNSRI